MNATIIENLKIAIEYIETLPNTRVNLEAFKGNETSCGTIFCAVGHLTNHPHFKAQGLALSDSYTNHLILLLPNGELDREVYSTARYGFLDKLFGPSAFGALFATYGEGDNDADLGHSYETECSFDEYGNVDHDASADNYPSEVQGPHHKELALLRLKQRLSEYTGECRQ